eukprot:TRINITY_DN53772_c0_g1_i1.p1 TRINITY_DN53772_c0_g1~~TRINITY_DN53772_c0_g1_i1.p1  ORF type:complete len:608 (-),score=25.58 TRINITY_DN53772_c0_g1_i1:875-2698(-)
MTDEAIRVVCRVRPLLHDDAESASIMFEPDGTSLSIDVGGSTYNDWHTYHFHKVFTDSSTQFDLYEEVAVPSLKAVLKGYNCAILAYGQTGSGKTYTMSGAPTPVDRGITPRILDELFRSIMVCKPGEKYTVRCSYVQIYNEKVLDLLVRNKSEQGKNMKIRQDPHLNQYTIPEARKPTVQTVSEVNALLALGDKNRIVAGTKANEVSSRSHSILMLYLEKRVEGGFDADGLPTEPHTVTSLLYLVDLAGSEMASKTDAQGQRLEEAKHINRSLHLLRNVIKDLTEGARHVTFRNSALTKLLQNSVGGNSKTSLIVCVSPDASDVKESDSSLMFGQMTAKVRLKSSRNVHKSAEELQALVADAQNTLLELRERLRRLEKRARDPSQLNKQRPQTAQVQDMFICPLSQRQMLHPVVCENGATYERTAIMNYWQQHKLLPPVYSGDKPVEANRMTARNKPLFIPNFSLEHQIQAYEAGGKFLRPRTTTRNKSFFIPYRRFPVWVKVVYAHDLPTDCVLVMCTYLSEVDLHATSKVCEKWNSVAADDSLWQTRIVARFGKEKVEEYNPLVMGMMGYYFKLVRAESQSGKAMPTTSIPQKKTKGFGLARAT